MEVELLQAGHACQDPVYIIGQHNQAAVVLQAQVGQAGGGLQAVWQPQKDIVPQVQVRQPCRSWAAERCSAGHQ